MVVSENLGFQLIVDQNSKKAMAAVVMKALRFEGTQIYL